MSIQEQELVKQEAYAEAMRYVQNATEILQKAHKEDKHYCDRKYVRIACGTAYSGVLVALDGYLKLKGIPEPKRKSIDYYRKSIGQIDRKLLADLNDAYDTLHLSGYYDGNLRAGVIREGFDAACDIIERLKPLSPIDAGEWAKRRRPSLIRRLHMLFA